MYLIPANFKVKSANTSQIVLFCRNFQRGGECSFVETHLAVLKGKNVIVQHICASCWLKGKKKCFHTETI